MLIATDMHMGGITSTRMPLRRPWMIRDPEEEAWL
jgi:hypothetical protein